MKKQQTLPLCETVIRRPVGRSSRTPFKHDIFDSELGRICGVVGRHGVPADANPYMHVIDLCAGDGRSVEGGTNSPAIIEKHGRFLMEKRGMQFRSTLIEKNDQTFAVLCSNTADEPWQQRFKMDARQFTLNIHHEFQAVFIHSDPNSIADWPITKRLTNAMSKATTLLATLGCNVGGLKRLTLEERLPWYGHVQEVIEVMPYWHDAILIELVGDASQWAYLLRLPDKWSAETAVRIRNSGLRMGFDTSVSSLRRNPKEFKALEDKLFLTKKERSDDGNS